MNEAIGSLLAALRSLWSWVFFVVGLVCVIPAYLAGYVYGGLREFLLDVAEAFGDGRDEAREAYRGYDPDER